MLPLGNRGSNNPELWPSQLQGMQGPVPRLSISTTVCFFFFFSGENSVIVDLALGLTQQAPEEHGGTGELRRQPGEATVGRRGVSKGTEEQEGVVSWRGGGQLPG